MHQPPMNQKEDILVEFLLDCLEVVLITAYTLLSAWQALNGESNPPDTWLPLIVSSALVVRVYQLSRKFTDVWFRKKQ